MSLEQLLEAAQYLDKIENGDASYLNSNHESPNQINRKVVQNGSSDNLLPGGHLRVDPNLPISFQFHTYSSASIPSAAMSQRVPSQLVSAASSTIPSSDRFHSTNKNKTSAPISFPGGQQRFGSSPLGSNQMMVIAPVNSVAPSISPIGRSSSSGGRGRGGRGGNSSSDDKDQLASTRHRELHKTLEKNRRAHLRSCFEQLKLELPRSEYSDKKTSHINIIHCAIKYIQQLKRTEWEHEHEIERLARTKIRYQNQLAQLKEDVVHEANENQTQLDVDVLLREAAERVIIGSLPSDDGSCSGAGYITNHGLMSGLIKTPIVGGFNSNNISKNDLEDEINSDGEVIVELEAEEYDDETTTTASECADDQRDSSGGSGASSFATVTVSTTPMLSHCHA